MNKEMLAGHTVGAISGGTSALVLAKMNQFDNYSISVRLVRDFNEGFDLLEEGHISAFVTDDIIIRGKLASIAEKDQYQMNREGFGEELSYGLVVAKNANELKTIINDEIKSLFTSGRFDKLYTKWLMPPSSLSGENIQQQMPEQLIDEENRLLTAGDNASQP